MRPKEKILIFLEFIKERKWNVFRNIFRFDAEIVDTAIDRFYEKEQEIKDFWLKNPDLRFSQILVNLGIIPNIPGSWYYIEEDEILEKLEIPTREYLLWGQNYDKNINLLPETIYKPIKDLSIEHIQAILDGDFAKTEKYIKCFKEELKLRENE